jgi:hypothetical protein
MSRICFFFFAYKALNFQNLKDFNKYLFFLVLWSFFFIVQLLIELI